MSYKRWEQIADDYSGNLYGRKHDPGDVVDYAMEIISLLSDAQHVDAGKLNDLPEANNYVNAAKVMLSRMIASARYQETKNVQ